MILDQDQNNDIVLNQLSNENTQIEITFVGADPTRTLLETNYATPQIVESNIINYHHSLDDSSRDIHTAQINRISVINKVDVGKSTRHSNTPHIQDGNRINEAMNMQEQHQTRDSYTPQIVDYNIINKSEVYGSLEIQSFDVMTPVMQLPRNII